MTDDLVPGSFVRNPAQPDWGLGQIQSVIGTRITVNFEHVGARGQVLHCHIFSAAQHLQAESPFKCENRLTY